MDALEAIRTRRSIRKYTQEPVSDEMVEKMPRAALRGILSGEDRNSRPFAWIRGPSRY